MVRSATRPDNSRGAGTCRVALRFTQPKRAAFVLCWVALCLTQPTIVFAQGDSRPAAAALIAAYPDFLNRVEDGALVWKDGTRMPLDDGKGAKSLEQKLADPDIDDMFSMPYPVGETGVPPSTDFDPGRVRYTPLFDKMYGNCLVADIQKALVPVVWLPSKAGTRIMFHPANGAAEQLRKVSEELDKLPAKFLEFLHPSAGSYNCRPIAGTKRLSAHGYGIAIDIALKRAHYWRWTKPDPAGLRRWRNEIPWEIVHVFERHGFIWGGKWSHYDTMHFEYRPELLAARRSTGHPALPSQRANPPP